MLLKPDRLNGQTIYRGVTVGSDGLNHQNQGIVFPPKIHAPHGPVKSPAELLDEAMKSVVPANQASEAMSRQLRKALAFWMKRARLNERERIRLALEKHGMKEAQHAMMDMTDG